MEKKRLCIFAEGLTEYKFCQNILIPHLYNTNSNLSYIWTINIVGVGKLEKYKYEKLKKTIVTQMVTDSSAIYTTLIDYYAFPKINIPGYTFVELPDPYQRVLDREAGFNNAVLNEPEIGYCRDKIVFNPFLMLHEFETLLLCDLKTVEETCKVQNPAFRELKNYCDRIGNPELINDNPNKAPSKRLANAVPGYQKTFDGIDAIQKIELNTMRQKCSHFAQWVAWLENIT